MGAQRGVLEFLRVPGVCAQFSHSAHPWLTVRHILTKAGRAGAALKGEFNLLMVCFKEEECDQGNMLATNGKGQLS